MELKSKNFKAILRVESSGRGGKTVTVIDGLPKLKPFLEALTKLLKNRCGSGGTYRMDGKEGLIEIQGDKRELVRGVLTEQGITVRG